MNGAERREIARVNERKRKREGEREKREGGRKWVEMLVILSKIHEP